MALALRLSNCRFSANPLARLRGHLEPIGDVMTTKTIILAVSATTTGFVASAARTAQAITNDNPTDHCADTAAPVAEFIAVGTSARLDAVTPAVDEAAPPPRPHAA
jgi:hypothetical protein